MDIEFETDTIVESVADVLLEVGDVTRVETTDLFINMYVKTDYGPVVIKRSRSADTLSFEAK